MLVGKGTVFDVYLSFLILSNAIVSNQPPLSLSSTPNINVQDTGAEVWHQHDINPTVLALHHIAAQQRLIFKTLDKSSRRESTENEGVGESFFIRFFVIES